MGEMAPPCWSRHLLNVLDILTYPLWYYRLQVSHHLVVDLQADSGDDTLVGCIQIMRRGLHTTDPIYHRPFFPSTIVAVINHAHVASEAPPKSGYSNPSET